MRFILNRKSELITYEFIINDTISYPLEGGWGWGWGVCVWGGGL